MNDVIGRTNTCTSFIATGSTAVSTTACCGVEPLFNVTYIRLSDAYEEHAVVAVCVVGFNHHLVGRIQIRYLAVNVHVVQPEFAYSNRSRCFMFGAVFCLARKEMRRKLAFGIRSIHTLRHEP